MKLKDYHIPPNSTIYLQVLLYAIPEDFDNVIFDLFWGYPGGKKDYLDASVFLYNDTEFVEVLDYNNRASKSCPAVEHSGDVMDNIQRLGHHTIKVSIKSIPPQKINKLVFTLSAWNSPNISKYPNPSLKFFEAKFPDRQLCSDEMSRAAHSQAVIMCCLTNKGGGGWHVFSLKHPSAGNAMNYDPLKKKIANLIKEGYI
jgi:stress response protein SCP2